MKQSIGHITFFLIAALLLISASYLAYSQWVGDRAAQSEAMHYDETADMRSHTAVIDTVRFFENPCYSYCEVPGVEGCESRVDQLTKTVMSVERNGRQIQRITAEDLKKMEPNTSLNMMLEAYTVSRKKGNKGTSFYVTVESFDAILEKTPDDHYLLRESGEAVQVFSAKDIAEILEETATRERLQELMRNMNRPL